MPGSQGSGPVPALFETNAQAFLAHSELRHEVFGPSTILIRCESQTELESVSRNLEGSLTATIHGSESDLREQAALLKILKRKAGRLIFNGYPTGVEVCAAIQGQTLSETFVVFKSTYREPGTARVSILKWDLA